jgi:glutamate synthase (NADPH/NADH) small chain
MWPKVLRTSTSHQEGCDREWSVMTTDFVGDKKSGVEALNAVDVDWEKKDGRFVPVKKAGTERTVEAQLVLLAMGFTREGNAGILNAFGVETGDDCAPCLNKDYMTNVDGVFVAGDLSQGASLVVRAIADGRRAADGVDRYLASQG